MKEYYIIGKDGKKRGIFGSYFAAVKYIDKKLGSSNAFSIKESDKE